MNIANKLTLLRVVMVPVFLALFLLDSLPLNYLWALIIFALASATDFLDGFLARKYNLVTDFGKFLDPLADKVLVVSALICFTGIGWAPSWVVAVIVAREFLVSGIRLVAVGSEDKTVIAASIWGKLKTASTMASIVIILAMQTFIQLGIIGVGGINVTLAIGEVLMYISCALTVMSGGEYLWRYRKLISPAK